MLSLFSETCPLVKTLNWLSDFSYQPGSALLSYFSESFKLRTPIKPNSQKNDSHRNTPWYPLLKISFQKLHFGKLWPFECTLQIKMRHENQLQFHHDRLLCYIYLYIIRMSFMKLRSTAVNKYKLRIVQECAKWWTNESHSHHSLISELWNWFVLNMHFKVYRFGLILCEFWIRKMYKQKQQHKLPFWERWMATGPLDMYKSTSENVQISQ